METRTELRKEMQRLAKRFLNIADKLNEKVSNYLDGSGFYVDYKVYTEVKNAEADFLAIYNQIYEEGIKPALNYEIAESVLDGYEEENNTPEDNTCTDKNDSSDIDYTDPKAINQAVLEKLYVIGQEVFDKYVHVNKEGSYTALHLHNEKNAMGEPIRVSFSENPESTVQVGPFRCKFPANFVFKLINRFEKLNNMGNKKMKVFTYGENPAEIVSAPCVYLDKNGNYNKAKKRVRKLSDKVSVLKLSKDSYRVMFLVFGAWYQIIDEYDENRIKWLLESLSENPDFVKEAVARYELYQEVPYSAVAREMNQAFRSEPDQAVESKDNVSHSPAYGDSETSQTLEQEEQEKENRIRERFPLEGVTVEENTTGPNGMIYFTVEGAGPVTEARVRADLKPGDMFNVYTLEERKYGVTYDGVSLNRSIWNELPDIVEYEEKYYPEDCPTDADGNRFYTAIREDYAPFPYVVVDRLDGSVWFFTDSEDEAKEWAADYNQEYSDGGKRKKQPDVEHEVIRTDLAKCAG